MCTRYRTASPKKANPTMNTTSPAVPSPAQTHQSASFNRCANASNVTDNPVPIKVQPMAPQRNQSFRYFFSMGQGSAAEGCPLGSEVILLT